MRETNTNRISRALLDWYDTQARSLPWRVPPGTNQRADPYRVWLSEVMLQQTTVAAVEGYFRRFTNRWPGVADLARAEDADVMAEWAGLGYYARARNLLKCARLVVAEHGGKFPDTAAALRALPGIGPYTSAAIAAIAFGRADTVVDGNVERVMARLFAEQTPLPGAKKILTGHASRLTPASRTGDHAQALMDLGATICIPRAPRCGLCPVAASCRAHALGLAAELPRKTPKKPKPIRYGHAYVARRSDGAWLLERRPNRGLLGGMLGWPGSPWGATAALSPPLEARWAEAGVEVRHTFTHFHLHLEVHVARVALDARPLRGQFVPDAEFAPGDLPTVMRKVHDAARGMTEVRSTAGLAC